MYTDWDLHENKTCQNLTWPSGAGREISKLFAFKHIFLSAILHVLFRATNSLFNVQYQKIRTIQEQLEAEIGKNLRTAQPEPKVTGSYKESVY